MAETKTAYPLDWPVGWKRAASRGYGRFNRREVVRSTDGATSWTRKKPLSVIDSIGRILEQLQKMGIGRQDVVVSTNVRTRLDGLPRSGERAPDDPGAAVYWNDYTLPPQQRMRCMAVDQYQSVEDNLAAIAATLEAMRAIERHGGAEILQRTFSGFAALPEKASEPWRDILGLRTDLVTFEAVDQRFRELARQHHPDMGGDPALFQSIVDACNLARKELGA